MPPTRRRRTLKTRWLIWRARFSIPTLLGRGDERKAIAVVTAVNGGLAILTISLFAWLADLPLVFPALGPTVFILFSSPFSSSAAPRSVIVGHFTGIASGYAVWQVMSHLCDGVVSLQAGGWPPLCSGAFALALTCLVLVRLSCPHPPACASAMIVALGGITDFPGLFFLAAPVVLVTIQAVAINRIACLPVPIWSPRDALNAAG